MGIVGPNGSGKSTLLKLLVNLDEPDEGEIIKQKGIHIAYIPQQTVFEENCTVYEAIEKHLKTYKPHGHLSESFLRSILGRAGFTDLEQKVSTLSGGWHKKLAISCRLCEEPDLLLMDEPTNHLDIHGLLWLESNLSQANFSWVAVSHDRYFLENTTNRICDVNATYPNCILKVDGAYGDYLEQKEEFLNAQQKQFESLKNKTRQEVEWLKKGPKARTTKAKYRIDKAHDLVEKLKDMRARQPHGPSSLEFNDTSRKTKNLVEITHLTHSIGDKPICTDINLILSPKMRLGILGANGSGKTTLLKLINGEQKPLSGKVRHAFGLKLVTFDQQRSQLNDNDSVSETLSPHGDKVIYQDKSFHVVTYGKRFGITRDHLVQKVGALSGGERARLLLARLMLQPADVLLLDEPTNDLDIPTLELLEESLLEFPGTIVLVSHDRFLMDRVCDTFIGLNGNGQNAVYASLSQWEEDILGLKKQPKDSETEKSENKKTKKQKSKAQISYKDKFEYEHIEEKILQAEENTILWQAKVDELATSNKTEELTQACLELNKFQDEVTRLYARWEELAKLMGENTST